MQRLGRRYVARSTPATAAAARPGRAATRPDWSTASTMCWPATAISSSTRSAHAWWRIRPRIA